MASDRAALKAFFETGDVPTEGQYEELIDSVPNIVNDYGNAPQFTRLADVTVLSADILTSNSTPVTLIAAPGAGKTAVPIRAEVQFISNGIAYTTNTNIEIRSPGSNTSMLNSALILSSSSTNFRRMFGTFLIAGVVNQFISNAVVQFRTGTGDPLVGNGDLRFFVTYYIAPI